MNKTRTRKTSRKNTKQENRNYDLLGIAVIIILGIIIYSNSFGCSFHFDDFASIQDNPQIRNLTDLKSWWNYSHSRLVGYYTFAINYEFNKLDVWGYHFVNLAIHLANACLVWWLTKLILSSPALKETKISAYKRELPFFTALLFVSHPLATQSVTYIVQRLTSLAAMFYLLSVTLYIAGRLTDKGQARRILLFTGSFISAVLALLTKQNAYTLPAAILMAEFFFISTRRIPVSFKDYRVIILLAGVILVSVFLVFNFPAGIFEPIRPYGGFTYTITPYTYLLTQFGVIVKYIQLLFLPLNLHLDYDFPVSESFFDLRTLLSFIFLLGVASLAVWLFIRKQRVISFGIAWFFLTLLVESSIIPIRDVINEHRTYLPSVGFFLAVTATVYLLLREKYRTVAFSILILVPLIYSFLTYERNKDWKDELSLWSDNVEKAPDFARPVYNRGCIYENMQQTDKAVEDYTRAIALDPAFARPYYNRGRIYGSRMQLDKAVSDYVKAIEIEPEFLYAYYNLGVTYAEMNDYAKAIDAYTKALGIDSAYAKAYYNRGVAYGETKQWDKAISDYSRTIYLSPGYKEAYVNRGSAYASTGQWVKAAADFENALRIDPGFAIAQTNLDIAKGYLKSRNARQ